MLCTKCGSFIPDGNAACPYCNASVDNPVIQSSGIPVAQPAQAEPFIRKNNMATVGLVFGIISLVLSFSLLFATGLDSSTKEVIMGFLIHPAILGIILSSVGIGKSRVFGGKGKAITGLIISICATIIIFIASNI